jgi:hypothetical protein
VLREWPVLAGHLFHPAQVHGGMWSDEASSGSADNPMLVVLVGPFTSQHQHLKSVPFGKTTMVPTSLKLPPL